MKKNKVLLMISGAILILTGCTKTTVCTIELDQGNYKITSEYTFKYNNDVVKNLNTIETIETTDEDILDQFEDILNQQLSPFNNLKYYEYKISREDGKLIERLNINYSKIDMDKLVEIDGSVESLLKNKKVSYESIISLYEQYGVKCK